jgi:probable F420-dependent oxidoreductase
MKFILQAGVDRVHSKSVRVGETISKIAAAIEKSGAYGCLLSEHPAPDTNWLHNDPAAHDCLDSMTALAFMAQASTNLRVITNVLVLPYRNPFITAKAGATLQVLSDNRFIMGVGVGYQKEEFEALGVPYKERGALTDEALETIHEIWKGGAVVKKGRHFNAPGNEPRPVPNPAPPIWVGGGSDKAVERSAKYGDGWMPHFSHPTNDPVVKASSVVSMEHFGEKVARLKEMRVKFGKAPDCALAVGAPVRPKTTTPKDVDIFLENTRKLQSYGVNYQWTTLPAASETQYLEAVAWFGEEIISKFKS